MEHEGCDDHPSAHQPGDHLGAEGPGRARHLSATRHLREDGLVGGDRPLVGDVRIAHGMTVPGQVDQQGGGQIQPRGPQPVPGYGAPELDPAPLGQVHDHAPWSVEPGRGPVSVAWDGVAVAQLDCPRPAGQPPRECHGGRFAVTGHAGDAGGQGGRRVDHHDVAGPEQRGEVAEVPVLEVDPAGGATGDHEPYPVPPYPPGLGRFRRFQLRR